MVLVGAGPSGGLPEEGGHADLRQVFLRSWELRSEQGAQALEEEFGLKSWPFTTRMSCRTKVLQPWASYPTSRSLRLL